MYKRQEENEAFLALKDFMYRTVYVDRSAKKEEQKVEKVLTAVSYTHLQRLLKAAGRRQLRHLSLEKTP